MIKTHTTTMASLSIKDDVSSIRLCSSLLMKMTSKADTRATPTDAQLRDEIRAW